MKKQQPIDYFLDKLYKNLEQISVSEKIEILKLVNDEYLDQLSMGKNPQQVVGDFGPVDELVKKIYLSKDIKVDYTDSYVNQTLQKQSKKNYIFLSLLLCTLIWFINFDFKFINIDNGKAAEKVITKTNLLTETIKDDIEEQASKEKVSDNIAENKFKDVDLSKFKKLEVSFTGGVVQFNPIANSKISWDCRGSSNSNQEVVTSFEDNKLNFDMKDIVNAKCKINVPEELALKIEGGNGIIELIKPHYSVNASLASGSIVVTPDANLAYRYDIDVENGKADKFKSSTKPKAYNIILKVVNGVVARE